MELEEMKSLWLDMSEKLEKQEVVTNQLIMEMTQQKYRNKFSKIVRYESLGAVVCFLFGIAILINFEKLDTWYLVVCGALTAGFMFLTPLLSLGALRKITHLDISKSNYKEALVRFHKSKKRWLYIQKGGMYLSVIVMFISMPVFSRIMGNDHFFEQDFNIGFYIFIAVVAVGVALFARWVFKCFKGITKSAEIIISELDQQN